LSNSFSSSTSRLRLFGETRERVGAALAAAVSELVPILTDEMRHRAQGTFDARLKAELIGSATRLSSANGGLSAKVITEFNEVAFKRLELNADLDPGDSGLGLLALMPEADLDEHIFAEDLTQRLRTAAGDEHAQLHERLQEVTGKSWNEEACPLGAAACAVAIVRALRSVTTERAIWTVMRPVLARELPIRSFAAWNDANEHLRAKGVLPLLTRRTKTAEATEKIGDREKAKAPSISVSIGKVANTKPPTANAPPDRALVEAFSARYGSAYVATDQVPVSAPTVTAAAASSPASAAQSTQLDGVVPLQSDPLEQARRSSLSERVGLIEAMQIRTREGYEFARIHDVLAFGAKARALYFDQYRRQLATQAGGSLKAGQAAVVDLVQGLFDYAVDDERTPNIAKPLFWRLQTPALALALLDSRYLSNDPRSLRRLVENLGAIATAFPDEFAQGTELRRRLETAVHTVETVADALLGRARVLSSQVEIGFSRAAAGVAVISDQLEKELVALKTMPEQRNRRDSARRPSQAIEAQVTESVRRTLEDRIKSREVPQSVKDFLLEVWLRQMRSSLLRDGPGSPEYRVSLQVVDDLLWSLDTSSVRQSRMLLAQRIPPVIKYLTQGIRSTGQIDERHRAFLDELFILHLRKMQNKAAAPASVRQPAATFEPNGSIAEPVAAAPKVVIPVVVTPTVEIVKPPVQALVPVAVEGSEDSEQRLLAVLNAIDLADVPTQPKRLLGSTDEALSRVQRACWLEMMNSDGSFSMAKVAWINSRRTVVLLVRAPERKAVSLRIDELRERLDMGRTYLIVSK
jgi:Protein of unknown function (DUF1631)